MSKKYSCDINDLLELFNESLSPTEVLTSKLMAQVSTAITKERLKLSMNQAEFAEYIGGANQSLVSRWEHGDYNFSIKKIAEIATALNLDVNITMMDAETSKAISGFHSTAVHTRMVHYSKQNAFASPKSGYSKPSYCNTKPISKEENTYATVC